MRTVPRALARVLWLLLAAAAAAGVLVSTAALVASTPPGRRLVASALVRAADGAVAGRFELDGIAVLPHGGVEVDGLRVFAPEGEEVLRVRQARIFADVTRLGAGVLGLSVEVEEPVVDLSATADGGLAIARAFSAPEAREPEQGAGGTRWSIRLHRVAIRDGKVRSRGNGDVPAFAVSGLAVDGRGAIGRGGSRAELRLGGRIDAPFAAPLAVDLAASLEEERLLVTRLDARVGDSGLEAVAEGDPFRGTGRVAVIRLGLDRRQVATLLAAASEMGGDVGATGFAASDGRLATAALRVEPRGEGAGGRADVAAAARLERERRAIGLDVRAEAVDPSRLASAAPPGRVTLSARGAAAGSGLADLRARLSLSLEPSSLRGLALGPARVEATARRGDVAVDRLEAVLPGARVSGEGRWRRAGPVSGRMEADAKDLALLAGAIASIGGVPMPPLAGSARATLVLSGTGAAPGVRGEVSAPDASLGDLSVSGLHLELEGSGPLRTGTARVAGTARRMSVPGLQALALDLRGAVGRAGADVALTAAVPALGRDPVELRVRGRFGPDRETLIVEDLLAGWPGQRFALDGQASVRLEGPSVDRLEVVSGAQRVTLRGGLSPDGGLDGWLEISRLDLASVPRGLLPEGLGLSGELSLTASASGRREVPVVEATLEIARGAVRGVEGVEAEARVRWDGEAARASAEATVRLSSGGEAEASFDLPVPIRGARPDAAVGIRLRAREVRVEDLLRALGSHLPAAGRLEVTAALEGTAGAPSLRADASLADGTLGEFDRLAVKAALENPGERATLRAGLAREGAALAAAEASLPLRVAALLADPGAAVRSAARAPIEATADVPGLDLASVAGMAGLPPEVRGRLSAAARADGTLAAPRGEVALEIVEGALAGYRGVGVRARAAASGEAVSLEASADLGEEEVARARGSLGAPLERLLRAEGREAVPVRADLSVARVSLAGAAGPDVLLSGTVEGRATVAGTLGAPVAEARCSGEGVTLAGRRLGDLEAEARYRDRRAAGEVRFEAASGGSLEAEASLGIDLAPGAARPAPLEAPASLRLRADALDLGFLAAVAPRLVRSASGRIAIDLAGQGPLRSLRPRGTVRLEGGRVATVDHGEWTEGVLDLAVDEGSVSLRRLEVRRGSGRLEASLSVGGLAGKVPARIEGRVAASSLTLVRGAQEVATLDGAATVGGELSGERLEAKVEVARTTVRLPKQLPRDLQSLERRRDIVVGRARTRPAPAGEGPAAAGPRGLEARVRVVAPHRIEVRSDAPRASVDLLADVTLELAGGELFAEGSMDVERGEVEPISGRNFRIEHGRVQFTGGPPRAAVLDVQAVHDNPQAKVTVTITGPLTKPDIALSSDPPMDDGAIAMLIATGQAEFRAGSGGVGTLSADEAGRAALGAVVSQVFSSLVADKLPLDSVAVDATTLRAGKHVGDRIYVAYIRRFDAKPEEGESTDEVQLQFRVSRRWKLEASAGTARTYGASLIWSKDY